MTDRREACCLDCDWHGPVCKTNAIQDIYERVEAGETMPAGECPSCGALAHLRDVLT